MIISRPAERRFWKAARVPQLWNGCRVGYCVTHVFFSQQLYPKIRRTPSWGISVMTMWYRGWQGARAHSRDSAKNFRVAPILPAGWSFPINLQFVKMSLEQGIPYARAGRV